MCISKPKPPPVPKLKPRPKTDETATKVSQTRRAATEQRGVFANIFTSTLGDSGYGSNINQ